MQAFSTKISGCSVSVFVKYEINFPNRRFEIRDEGKERNDFT